MGQAAVALPERDERHGVHDDRHDVLERVHHPQLLGQEHPQHAQEQHAEPRAEVRAVDAGEQHAAEQYRGPPTLS